MSERLSAFDEHSMDVDSGTGESSGAAETVTSVCIRRQGDFLGTRQCAVISELSGTRCDMVKTGGVLGRTVAVGVCTDDRDSRLLSDAAFALQCNPSQA